MPDDEWYQQALTPPEVLEINLRFGIIPERDHGQVLAEIKDPMTGVLIAQASVHHFPLRDLRHHVVRMTEKVIGWADEHAEPF